MPSLFILKKFRDWEGASRVSACCTSVENWVQISPNAHQSEHRGAWNRSEGGRLRQEDYHKFEVRQDYVAHTRQANPSLAHAPAHVPPSFGDRVLVSLDGLVTLVLRVWVL